MLKINGWFGFWFKGILIGVLILGIVLRLGNLDIKPYWEDEVYTSMRVSGYEQKIVEETISGKPILVKNLSQYQDVKSGKSWIDTSIALAKRTEHTPLYFLLARAWAEVFGSSVGSMRAFPAFVSLLTLPLFYWLALLLFESPVVASTTLCIVCVSPIMIRYAQEARPYSLWIVCILLSSIMLLKSLRLDIWRVWFVYSATISLAFLTHLLSGFLFIVHGLYVLILYNFQGLGTKVKTTEFLLNSSSLNVSNQKIIRQKKVRHFYIAFAVGLIPLLPWFGLLIYNRSSVQAVTAWLDEKTSLIDLIFAWEENVSDTIFGLFPEQHYLLLFFGIILLIVIAWSAIKMILQSHIQSWLMPILFCAIPSSILIASDLLLGGIKSAIPRYFIPTNIGMLLILGFGLSPNYLKGQNSLKVYAWIKSLVFHAILVIAISASCFNFQSSTWWGQSSVVLQTAQAITHAYSDVKVISDRRLGAFMSFAFLLRPTDSILWLKPNQNPAPEDIFGDSRTVFLFEPSDGLLDRVNELAEPRQYILETFSDENTFQIKKSFN